MSLLNGLSQMGTAISQFAGQAGLQQQKQDAEAQMQTLANQLAAEREHQGRVESGQIAAEQQGRAQAFQASQSQAQRDFEANRQDKQIEAQKNLTGMEINSRKDIVQQQLDAGRYVWQPGTKDGEEGMWKLPTRGDESPVFVPGSTITPKYSQITPNQALSNARADFNRFVKQDKDNGGNGTVYNSDGSIADSATWITDRAEKYRTGKIGGQGGQPQPTTPVSPPKITDPIQIKQSIDNARTAIKNGAPREGVIQRLRDNGITPPADL